MPVNLKYCLETLALLAQAELAVGRLYGLCAQRWPQYADFWEKLAHREQQHSQYAQMLATLVETKPDEFRQGRNFTPAAINTFIGWVENASARVAKGELDSRKAFFAALDIERSVIKRNFFQIVETDNKELAGFIKKVAAETLEHSRLINTELQRHTAE